MVGIALIALLLGQAVPSFSVLIERQTATQAIQALATAIRLTRHVALAHQTPAILCPVTHSDTSCGRDWAHGQLLFLDANRNNALDADETVIRRWPALPQGSRLTLRAFGGRSYLRASAGGLITHQNGHFLYCPRSQKPHDAKQLIFNALGRARLAIDTDGDGIAEDSGGDPLECT